MDSQNLRSLAFAAGVDINVKTDDPILVGAVCVPAQGWMSNGYGICKLTIRNTGSSPAKLIRWDAHWECEEKPAEEPIGGEINIELGPGQDITRNGVGHLPESIVEKSKPAHPVLVGSITVESGGTTQELPFSFCVPAAKIPEELESVVGKHIGFSLMKSRFKDFPGKDNIIRWLDQSYEVMQDLTSYTHLDGEVQMLEECPAHPWWAYAGNPMVCNTDYVGMTVDEINGGCIIFGWIHEMGHNFDFGTGDDWYNWSAIACEWSANWKLSYVYENIPDQSFKARRERYADAPYPFPGALLTADGHQFVDSFFVFGGDKYLADPNRSWETITTDHIHSFFARIQRSYGWEPFKRWYRAYSRFVALGCEKPETPEVKVQLIAAILSHETGVDLVPSFQRWKFPVTHEDVESLRKKYPIRYRRQLTGNIITAPLKCESSLNPVFQGIAKSEDAITCEFKAKPETKYRVFAGLVEDEWDQPEKRIVDVFVQGDIVGQIDTFKRSKGTLHGLIFSGVTDRNGILNVSVKVNAASKDRKASICGFILLPDDETLSIDQLINWENVNPLLIVDAMGNDLSNVGLYYPKVTYKPEPIASWEDVKLKLPAPIFDEKTEFVGCYWKLWKETFNSIKQPLPGSYMVANHISRSYDSALDLTNTALLCMVCNYGHAYAPGIQSLDNFYRMQAESGALPESLNELTGLPSEKLIPGRDSFGLPITAWAEREWFRLTANRTRWRIGYQPIAKHYQSCKDMIDPKTGLCGDTLRQNALIALFARDMASIASGYCKQDEADRFQTDAEALRKRINEVFFDNGSRDYKESTNGESLEETTIPWLLMAGIPCKDHAAALGERVDIERLPDGLITTFVTALARYGLGDKAHAVAMEHLTRVCGRYEAVTGSVVDNSAVVLMIEQILGIYVDAPSNTVVWNIRSQKRVGVERLWFGGKTLSIVCEEADCSGNRLVKAESDGLVNIVIVHNGQAELLALPGARSEEISIR